MKILLLYLLCFFISPSQTYDTLFVHTIYPVKSDPAFKMYKFENDFFQKLIQLYNSKHDNKFFIKYRYFKDFNNLILSLKKSDYSCAFGQITIGFLHNVDYSEPYFPVRNSLIKKKSDYLNLSGEKKVLVGFIDHEYYKNLYLKLTLNYTVRDTIIDKYEDLLVLLKKGSLDSFIGDSIDAWVSTDLEIIMHIDEKTNFLGFIYPKKSAHKEAIDSTLKYYIKTNSFYNLLRKYFGKKFAGYYKQTFEKIDH